MIWVFWGLLIFLVGGLFLLAALARRRAARRRPGAMGPVVFRKALFASIIGALWALGPRLHLFSYHEPPFDLGKDYSRQWSTDRQDDPDAR